MTLIITAEDVSTALGISVNNSDVVLAQQTIEAVTGLNLSWADSALHYTKRDLRILRSAVTAQVQYLSAHPEVLTSPRNVSGASANGIAVSYTPGSDGGSDGLVGPVTARYLATLSDSHKKSKTVYVAPWNTAGTVSFLTDEVVVNGVRY